MIYSITQSAQRNSFSTSANASADGNDDENKENESTDSGAVNEKLLEKNPGAAAVIRKVRFGTKRTQPVSAENSDD